MTTSPTLAPRAQDEPETTPDPPPGAPRQVGRYVVERLLGAGAMGVVYLARDPAIGRHVALKTIRLAPGERERTLFESRFFKEARSAGQLSHPGIVTIHDVGEQERFAYIAMEYLDGGTLGELLDREGRVAPARALDIAFQLAEALAYAHGRGVVHRDVKPGNIFLRGARAILADFGIAHLASSSETRVGQLMGSPRYMSPEQVRGDPVDGRSDLFSLGVVLYEMLTGAWPFDGERLHTILYRVVEHDPPPPSRVRPGLPAFLDPLLSRLLAKRPEARFPDARAAAAALLAARRCHAGLERLLAMREPLPRWLVGAGAVPLMALGLVALGVVALQPMAPAMPPGASPADTGLPGDTAAIVPADAAPASGPFAGRLVRQPTPAELARRRLEELHLERARLLAQYTDLHPDVRALDRQIALTRMELARREAVRSDTPR